MTRKISAKAREIAKRSQKEGIFVYASFDGVIEKAENSTDEMLKSVLSSYDCEDCSSVFVSQAKTTPFCVTCGSHHVKEKAKVEDTASLELSDSNLAAITCVQCKATNIMTRSTVAAMGEFACTTCGSHLKASVTDIEQLPEGEVTVIPDDNGADNKPLVTLDTDEIAEVEFEDDDEFDYDEDVVAEGDLFADDDDNGEADILENHPNVDEVRLEDVEVSGPADAFRNTLDTMVDDQEVVDEVTYSDSEDGDDLIDAMDIDDTVEDLEFARVGARLLAMKGYVTVATITEAAGVDIDSTAFRRAVTTLARKEGLRKSLATLQFKPVKVKTVTAATLEKIKAEAADEATARIQASFEEIGESVALAAAGLARNQLAEFDNPLHAKLAAFLASRGVRGSEKEAAKFCLEAGEPYTTVLMEAASQLREKGSDFRQVLAATFKMTKASAFDNVSEGEEEEALDDAMSVTSTVLASLARPAIAVKESKPQQIATATNIYDKLSKPLGLGGYNG